MYHVLIAEHHQLIGEALSGMLEGNSMVRVCQRAASTEELCRAARQTRPDVVLLDLHLPPAGGLDAMRRLLTSMPKLRIICMGLARLNHDDHAIDFRRQNRRIGYDGRGAVNYHNVRYLIDIVQELGHALRAEQLGRIRRQTTACYDSPKTQKN